MKNPVGRPKIFDEPRKTVTVKLSDKQFDQLRLHAFSHFMTNQDILVAALEDYLKGAK